MIPTFSNQTTYSKPLSTTWCLYLKGGTKIHRPTWEEMGHFENPERSIGPVILSRHMATFDHFPNFTSDKSDWLTLQIICWFTDFRGVEIGNNLHRWKENALSFSKMWKISLMFQRGMNFCEKHWQTLFCRSWRQSRHAENCVSYGGP